MIEMCYIGCSHQYRLISGYRYHQQYIREERLRAERVSATHARSPVEGGMLRAGDQTRCRPRAIVHAVRLCHVGNDRFEFRAQCAIALNASIGPNPVGLAKSLDGERVIILDGSSEAFVFERGFELLEFG
jgi:hypothetical protein